MYPAFSNAVRHLRWASLAIALISVSAQASFSSLVVFGDSLSDTGNIYAATGGFVPGSPYDSGRFSNGPLYIDVLADHLGLSSGNSLAGGSNFAYGGAKVVPDGSSTPSLSQQYDTYIGSAGVADSNALYVVFGGANDLFNSTTAVEAEAAANGIVAIVGELVSAGAQHILVPNLPDLSSTPGNLGDVDIGDRTLQFNTSLSQGLSNLGNTGIILLDVYSILGDAIADPASYGFSNVTEACYLGGLAGGGLVCADPDSYIFWDSVHPTAAGHQILGDNAFAAVTPVPLPSALGLFVSGLLVLFGQHRRRAS